MTLGTRTKVLFAIVGSLAVGLITNKASALEKASAVISSSALGGGVFQYTIALTNTSTDGSNIGTYWFSWVPGADYMSVKPTNITGPTGWISPVTGPDFPTDGYAIENYNSTGLAVYELTPGNTFDFGFQSTETLAQILGASPSGAHPVETTAFVYSGFPEGDTGFELTATAASVPEPVSASLIALCSGGLMLRRRRA